MQDMKWNQEAGLKTHQLCLVLLKMRIQIFTRRNTQNYTQSLNFADYAIMSPMLQTTCQLKELMTNGKTVHIIQETLQQLFTAKTAISGKDLGFRLQERPKDLTIPEM